MKKTGSTVLLVVMAAIVSACGTTAGSADPSSSTTAQAARPTTPAKPSANTLPSPATTLSSTALPAHKDSKSAISRERSVFFAYDDFSIGSTSQSVITNHGQYLQANSKMTIRIEGHADERGSAEYNLALGQRRAESVMRALKLYGVKDGQMEAVSYGEERPRTSGHDESAWAQNRRADIAYRD